MLNIGPQELILVLIIALIVVGPSRLPELGRSIGKAMREFRKVQDEVKDTFRFDPNDDPAPAARAPGPGPSRPPTAPAPNANGEARDATGPDEPGEAAPTPTTVSEPAAEAPTDDAGRDRPSTGPEPSA